MMSLKVQHHRYSHVHLSKGARAEPWPRSSPASILNSIVPFCFASRTSHQILIPIYFFRIWFPSNFRCCRFSPTTRNETIIKHWRKTSSQKPNLSSQSNITNSARTLSIPHKEERTRRRDPRPINHKQPNRKEHQRRAFCWRMCNMGIAAVSSERAWVETLPPRSQRGRAKSAGGEGSGGADPQGVGRRGEGRRRGGEGETPQDEETDAPG